MPSRKYVSKHSFLSIGSKICTKETIGSGNPYINPWHWFLLWASTSQTSIWKTRKHDFNVNVSCHMSPMFWDWLKDRIWTSFNTSGIRFDSCTHVHPPKVFPGPSVYRKTLQSSFSLYYKPQVVKILLVIIWGMQKLLIGTVLRIVLFPSWPHHSCSSFLKCSKIKESLVSLFVAFFVKHSSFGVGKTGDLDLKSTHQNESIKSWRNVQERFYCRPDKARGINVLTTQQLVASTAMAPRRSLRCLGCLTCLGSLVALCRAFLAVPGISRPAPGGRPRCEVRAAQLEYFEVYSKEGSWRSNEKSEDFPVSALYCRLIFSWRMQCKECGDLGGWVPSAPPRATSGAALHGRAGENWTILG